MSFDPEKVERYFRAINGMEVVPNFDPTAPAHRYVCASDYDQLLSLYREAVRDLKVREVLITELGSRLPRRNS